jgi:hypothetical protein
MSGHTTTRLVTTSGAAVLLALMATTGPAAAVEPPEPGGTSGSSATLPGPPNYPEYDPRYELAPVAKQDTGIDTSSAALGALGGIALGGAGLGIALAVSRRHHHPQSV